jgi:NTP pyrophosphatase (non-canonical NTP hydrolase)
MCYAIDAMNHHPNLRPLVAMDAHYDCAPPVDSAENAKAAPITGERVPTIEDWQQEVYENNVAHGWFEEDRPFAADVALLHSEVSEMLEAHRAWGLEDCTGTGGHARDCEVITWKVFVRGGAAPPCTCSRGALPKPEGVGSEMADVLIRLLDTAQRTGVDLRAEYCRKMEYNRTRPIKHGKAY